MPLKYKTVLVILILWLSTLGAEAAKGPVLLNVDIPPGEWKAIRLKNLPEGATVALEVKSDGEVLVSLLNSKDYQRFPEKNHRPLFLGRVKEKISFSVSIPDSGDYYVVLDNRAGPRQRAVTVIAGAEAAKADTITAAETILRTFERQLHQIFIFNTFHVGLERCDPGKAFGSQSGIVICADYIQKLYAGIGNPQKAKEALAFSIFHELGRILIDQWGSAPAFGKTTADAFAAVLMIMLNQTNTLTAHAENIVQNPRAADTLKKEFKDGHHPLTVKRAQRILGWLQDPGFASRWQSFLVPRMQTRFLKKLRENPAEWSDPALVEKELERRFKKSAGIGMHRMHDGAV